MIQYDDPDARDYEDMSQDDIEEEQENHTYIDEHHEHDHNYDPMHERDMREYHIEEIANEPTPGHSERSRPRSAMMVTRQRSHVHWADD